MKFVDTRGQLPTHGSGLRLRRPTPSTLQPSGIRSNFNPALDGLAGPVLCTRLLYSEQSVQSQSARTVPLRTILHKSRLRDGRPDGVGTADVAVRSCRVSTLDSYTQRRVCATSQPKRTVSSDRISTTLFL